jgi:hypothetical protein
VSGAAGSPQDAFGNPTGGRIEAGSGGSFQVTIRTGAAGSVVLSDRTPLKRGAFLIAR